MHVNDIARADLEDELADRLKKGQTLDVADRSADLRDDHVNLFRIRHLPDARLDLVSNVRDDLHSIAEIVARAALSE